MHLESIHYTFFSKKSSLVYYIDMKEPFSRINLFLIFFNLCLMLGIAYLWYPTFRDFNHGISEDDSNVQITTVANDRTGNSELRTSLEETPTTSDQLQVTSSTPTTTSENDIEQNVEDTQHVLPATVNLDVPFTSQAPESNWEQPWQDACEEAAILMLDAYYKKYNLSPLFAKDELLKMVDWETERGWGYSISLEDIKTVAAWYMGDTFSFRIQKEPSIDGIKQTLAAGNPVLVVAYGKSLDNPNFTNGGPEYHALIIRGYTDEGFITNDPGTRNGKEFFYTYENLMSSIHDWNGGDVESGDAVVMVAEKL